MSGQSVPSFPGRQQVAVVIPAWQPEPVLGALVAELLEAGFGLVLVVDDGSSPASRPLLTAAERHGARVLHHGVNRGKGRALKTGFACVLAEYPAMTGVVTADADGQHTAADIVRVAEALAGIAGGEPVLGVRRMSRGVPLRSRVGNAVTRVLFGLMTGVTLPDTQTGLRAFPRALLPDLLRLQGERYEYEMNVLVHLCRRGRRPVEIPIQTVYLESNRSSHFKPVRDSLRVYRVLLHAALRRTR